MALLRKCIFYRLCLNDFKGYPYSRNEFRLSRVQYYTCLCNAKYFESQSKKLRLEGSQLNFTYARKMGLLDYLKDISRSTGGWLAEIRKGELEHGLLWYKTTEQVNYIEFYTLLNLEDSFYTWFKVMELHTWMILVRLKHDKKTTIYTRKGVMEAFWADAEKRAKDTHSLNKNYKKNIESLYNKFKITLFIYDQGLLGNDMVLADALWCKFFDEKYDDPRKLEALISFIRYQINYLFTLDSTIRSVSQMPKVWTSFSAHFGKGLH